MFDEVNVLHTPLNIHSYTMYFALTCRFKTLVLLIRNDYFDIRKVCFYCNNYILNLYSVSNMIDEQSN